MLPVFYHAFHFTGDGRSAVGKYFKVAAKAWPDLLHVEPKLLPDSKPQYAAPQSQPPPCVADTVGFGAITGLKHHLHFVDAVSAKKGSQHSTCTFGPSSGRASSSGERGASRDVGVRVVHAQ